MPRINSTEQYRRHDVLKMIWRDHPKLYGILPAHQQWRLHRYYQPTINCNQIELDEHRSAATTIEPSLAHEAGKSFRQLERLYRIAIEFSQHTGAPLDDCLNAVIQHVVLRRSKVVLPGTTATNPRVIYVVGVTRPEPDAKLLTKALRQLACDVSEKKSR